MISNEQTQQPQLMSKCSYQPWEERMVGASHISNFLLMLPDLLNPDKKKCFCTLHEVHLIYQPSSISEIIAFQKCT